MFELKASEYSEQDKYQVLRSSIKRFEKLRDKEKEGVRPFFCSRDFQKSERVIEKEEKN